MKITQLIEVLNSLLETRVGDNYIVNKYSPYITGSEAICRYNVFLRVKEKWNDWKNGRCYFRTIEVEIKGRPKPLEVIQMLAG